jgi:archaellum biogenesis ATPase FlaH
MSKEIDFNQAMAAAESDGVYEEIQALFDSEERSQVAKKITKFKRRIGFDIASKPTWLVDGLLTKGSINVIYGESGSGKTMVVMDLLVSLLNGESWLGCKSNIDSVAYFTDEGNESIGQHFFATCLGHGLDNTQSQEVNRKVSYYDVMPNLADEESMTLLINEITLECADELPFGIAIVDTYSRAMAGNDENSNGVASKAFEHCKAMVKQGIAQSVILVHHTNKVNGGMRGASGIYSNADTVIKVEGNGESGRNVSVTKLKALIPNVTPKINASYYFDIVTEANEGGRVKWLAGGNGSSGEVHDVNYVKVESWIKDCKVATITSTDLGKAMASMSISQHRQRDITKKLINSGLISEGKRGARGLISYNVN